MYGRGNQELATGSSSWVMFPQDNFDIGFVYDLLLETGLSVLQQRDKVAIWLDNGPMLFITSVRGEAVRLKSMKIGKGSLYSEELSKCDARVEITFDDLQAVRKEEDTLIEVQSTLQEVTEGYIFNAWNRRIAPPPEFENE